MDLDAWLGYTTKKTVYIQDRWLGLIYYSLVICILLYVFGVQILMHNQQFLLSSVEGIARMKVEHPTKGFCDISQPDCKSEYRSLQDLPYCNAYTGKTPLRHTAPCKFEDATSIMPNGEVDNKIFLPTAIEIVTEKRACKATRENGYNCDNEYEELPGSDCINGKNQCRTRGGVKDQFYYVADTKNFQVQFTSSYEEGDVHGTSLDHPAYYEICPARLREANRTHLWPDRLQHSQVGEAECDSSSAIHEKLPCAPGVMCRQRRAFDWAHDTGVNQVMSDTEETLRPATGSQRKRKSTQFLRAQDHLSVSGPLGVSSDLPLLETHLLANHQQYTSAYGDVFKLDRLMELAGTDLDLNFNMDGWSTRESGTVLEVSVVYKNMHPFYSTFGYKEPEYFYRVKELPLPYVSRRQLAVEQPSDYPETRRYEIRHGIMIWFRVVGEFGNFSGTYLLIYLVTAFALIGAASSITDFLAIYVHKRKNNYFNLKYEISGDFSDMWQCPECAYWNSQVHGECQSYPMWKSRDEAPRCGTPMPPKPHIPSGRVLDASQS